MNALTRVSLAVGLALLPHVVLADNPPPIKPKVMLITMFAPRRKPGSTASSLNKRYAFRACPPNIP